MTTKTDARGYLHLGGDAWCHPNLAPLVDDLAKVTPHPDNPRNGDTDAITESIVRHGLYAGIVAQTGTGRVIVGNHRYAALLGLGADRCPITWTDVNDDLALRIMLGDNKIGDLARNDEAQLLQLVRDLDGLEGTGFTQRDIERLINRVEQPLELLQGLTDGDRLVDDEAALARATADNPDLFHLPFGLTPGQREVVLDAIRTARQRDPDLDGSQALTMIAASFLDRVRQETAP